MEVCVSVHSEVLLVTFVLVINLFYFYELNVSSDFSV